MRHRGKAAHLDETFCGKAVLDDLFSQSVLVHAVVRWIKDGPRGAASISVRGAEGRGCPTWTSDGSRSAGQSDQALVRPEPDGRIARGRSVCLRGRAWRRAEAPRRSPARRFEVIAFESLFGEDAVDRAQSVRVARLCRRDGLRGARAGSSVPSGARLGGRSVVPSSRRGRCAAGSRCRARIRRRSAGHWIAADPVLVSLPGSRWWLLALPMSANSFACGRVLLHPVRLRGVRKHAASPQSLFLGRVTRRRRDPNRIHSWESCAIEQRARAQRFPRASGSPTPAHCTLLLTPASVGEYERVLNENKAAAGLPLDSGRSPPLRSHLVFV